MNESATADRTHIVAIGGGGFAANPPDVAIDRYLLSLARRERPTVGFIPTATGDLPAYVARFMAVYGGLECRPSYLPLFTHAPDLEAWVRAQDVIFVGGGNTRSMLAVWRAWGLPELLRDAHAAGTVLAGQSAGAICWFAQGVTDSWAGSLRPLDCLGFLEGSCCPHYNGEKERRPAYRRFVGDGAITPGIAIDDGAAAHYVDGKLEKVLAWREDASAYRLAAAGGEAREERLDRRRLEPSPPDWPVG